MLFLISPAKSLDYDTPVEGDVPHSQPLFVKQAAELISILRELSPQDVAELMQLSDKLSAMNVARYALWRARFTAKNSKQAILAFDGDVYDGLQAKTLKLDALEWAQEHVCILSGLYGVLRPLDWMQAYRLEMGTSLANAKGNNLYDFWGSQISEYLNKRLIKDKAPVVVNLASREYFRSVQTKTLKARVVECVFEEFKSGQYKVISFSAKRARGMMVRFAIEKRITEPEQLQGFARDGYRFDKKCSSEDRYVFRRKQV